MADVEEMRRMESEAVSSSDDCKIVADTPDFVDGFSGIVRTATGVRISANLGEKSLEGIVDSNESKSDSVGAVPVVITLPVKDEVTSDGNFACVNNEIVESEQFREKNFKICVKEEPDLLHVMNQVSDQEEETITESIEKFVVETVSRAPGNDCNLKLKVEEPDLHVESLVVAQEEEIIADSIAKSVVETVSRGSCFNVKEEPDLVTRLDEDSQQNKYVSVSPNVIGEKDEVTRAQEGQCSGNHGSLQENKILEQEIDSFISESSDGTSNKRRKTEIEGCVKSSTMPLKPHQVFQVKPEVHDEESENLNPLVKMEPVEEVKVDTMKLSMQLTEIKSSFEKKPVYVKKAPPVHTRKVQVEDGDFPVEKDWSLVGRSLVTATSTSKGRKLEDNEVVNFTFSAPMNWKVTSIVRFSTKRCGEVSHFLT